MTSHDLTTIGPVIAYSSFEEVPTLPEPVIPEPVAIPEPVVDTVAVPGQPDPTQTVLTIEARDHAAQIIARPFWREVEMTGLAAVGIDPRNENNLLFNSGLSPIGTNAYVVVRRLPRTPGSSIIPIVVAAYRARFTPDGIVIGGAENNLCAYDLRFRPFPDAEPGGKIMSTERPLPLRMALMLDQACENVVMGEDRPVGALTLPFFLGAFRPDDLPSPEPTKQARMLAMRTVAPNYNGPPLAVLKSPGGTVASVELEDRTDGRFRVIRFEGTSDSPREVLLPAAAVLRPYVRPGMTLEAGAPLGDFVPRRLYVSHDKFAEIFGEHTAKWLLREAVQAADEQIGGLVYRSLDYCSREPDKMVGVYEDVRHLVDDFHMARLQVVEMRTPQSLSVTRSGLVADLFTIRKEWQNRYEPGDPTCQERKGRNNQRKQRDGSGSQTMPSNTLTPSGAS